MNIVCAGTGPGSHAQPDGECNCWEGFSQWVACTENSGALQSAAGVIAKLGRDGLRGNRGVGPKCLLTTRVGVIVDIALQLLQSGV